MLPERHRKPAAAMTWCSRHVNSYAVACYFAGRVVCLLVCLRLKIGAATSTFQTASKLLGLLSFVRQDIRVMLTAVATTSVLSGAWMSMILVTSANEHVERW